MDPSENVTVPVEYLCPITNELMWDPVGTETGHVYSRQGITEWFKQKLTDPNTGLTVSGILIPNIILRNLIRDFMTKHSIGKVELQEYILRDGVIIPRRKVELYPWELSLFEDPRNSGDAGILKIPEEPEKKYVIWLKGTYDPDSFHQGLRYTQIPTRAFKLSEYSIDEIRVDLFAKDTEGVYSRIGAWTGPHVTSQDPYMAYNILTKGRDRFPKLTPQIAVVPFRLDSNNGWVPTKDHPLDMGDVVILELFQMGRVSSLRLDIQ